MAKKKAKKSAKKKAAKKRSVRRTAGKRSASKTARRKSTKKKSTRHGGAKKHGRTHHRSKKKHGGTARASQTWDVTIFSDGTADPDPLPDPLDPTQKVKPGDKVAWFAADPSDDVSIDFDKPEGNPFDPSEKKHPANGHASSPIKGHLKRKKYGYSVYVNGTRYDPVIVIDP